jgi:hypothetical protein
MAEYRRPCRTRPLCSAERFGWRQPLNRINRAGRACAQSISSRPCPSFSHEDADVRQFPEAILEPHRDFIADRGSACISPDTCKRAPFPTWIFASAGPTRRVVAKMLHCTRISNRQINRNLQEPSAFAMHHLAATPPAHRVPRGARSRFDLDCILQAFAIARSKRKLRTANLKTAATRYTSLYFP